MTFKRKAVPFDTFVGGCNYFDSNSDVNNGYGCTHPEQEEKQKGKGCCFCFSCPLGTPADEESFEEPDIDWNGTEKEDVGEDDYIIIASNCENQNLGDNYDKRHVYEKGITLILVRRGFPESESGL